MISNIKGRHAIAVRQEQRSFMCPGQLRQTPAQPAYGAAAGMILCAYLFYMGKE